MATRLVTIMEEKIIILSKRIVLFSSSLLTVILIIIAFSESFHLENASEWHQLILPGLSRIDRCISCHPDSAMAKRHLAMSLLRRHETDEYGCTICHQGEGRAVNIKSAHVQITPFDYIQSNCAQCHLVLFNASHRTQDCDLLSQGKKTLYHSGCLGCHKIRGTGGAVGPDLTAFSNKPGSQFNYTHVEGKHTIYSWLHEHFDDPGKISPGSQMFAFNFQEQEMQAFVTLIAGLKAPIYNLTYYELEILKEFADGTSERMVKNLLLRRRRFVGLARQVDDTSIIAIRVSPSHE